MALAHMLANPKCWVLVMDESFENCSSTCVEVITSRVKTVVRNSDRAEPT
jgi:hypothetical protein